MEHTYNTRRKPQTKQVDDPELLAKLRETKRKVKLTIGRVNKATSLGKAKITNNKFALTDVQKEARDLKLKDFVSCIVPAIPDLEACESDNQTLSKWDRGGIRR